MNEHDFNSQITDLVKLGQWDIAYHVFEQERYARRTLKGFPDWLLVKTLEDGITITLAVELKSEKGRLTAQQIKCLELLNKTEGIYSFVWIPSQIDEIVVVLRARGLPDIIEMWKRHALFAKDRFGLSLATQQKG